MATTSKTKRARVVAVAVEIFCPHCERTAPIPAKDGSYMWDFVPAMVVCPDCKSTAQTNSRHIEY